MTFIYVLNLSPSSDDEVNEKCERTLRDACMELRAILDRSDLF